MVNLLISTFTWLLMKKIQFICRTQRSSKNNRVTTELRSTSVSRTCCCSIFYFILGLNFCKHCHTFLYRKTKERKLKPRIKLNHNKHMQLLNIHFLFMITVTHALKVPMDYMFLLSIRHTLYSRKFLCTAKIKMIFQQKKYDDISCTSSIHSLGLYKCSDYMYLTLTGLAQSVECLIESGRSRVPCARPLLTKNNEK